MSHKVSVAVRVEARAEIATPLPPNFLRHADALVPPRLYDVAELSDDDLRRVGAAWTEALIANAARRRLGIR